MSSLPYHRTYKTFKNKKYLCSYTGTIVLVKSFDGKTYMFVKHVVLKGKVLFPAVWNKIKVCIGLYPIPTELKLLNCLERILIYLRILFTKIAIMHGWKGRVCKKNKEPVYDVPTESTDLSMQYHTKTSWFWWIYCFEIKKRP